MVVDNFTPALVQTLNFEGGIRKTPDEYSNRGVRQDLYNEYAKSKKLEVKDVKDLTKGEVWSFYKDNYWDGPKISQLGNQKASELLFDFGVNAGPGTAIKKLQEIVGAKSDGLIGPKTKAAVGKFIEKNGESALLSSILNARAVHYQDLYLSNPQRNAQNIDGWINRVTTLKKKYLGQ